jgi:4-amino-4-deoxy-L-arabinose transferase-like glycosyltransferase
MSRNEAITRSAARPAAARRQQENASTRRLLFDLFAIVAFAALARLVFFSEALGSDEIVYLTRAQHILQGEYPQAVYIGAMRDGINIFVAASILLFGTGIGGASGLFFACSLGQVLLAFSFAYILWGRRTAIWAALCMAVLPIEITLAGGLGPDPYLGFVITCSIVAFYFAERDGRAALYLAAGLLAGWVFWIKPPAIVFSLVFPLLVLACHPRGTKRIWFVVGAMTLLIAHLALFWVIYGDPVHFFRSYQDYVKETYVAGDFTDTSLSAYVVWLFVKIYHTGLLGWLALAGWIRGLTQRNQPEIRFVMIWGLGLLLIFSVLPISLSPLKFIAKQSNYMTIFTLPLALMAGWFLAQQGRTIALLLGGAMIASGIFLAALEQQVVSVVTVNGRSAVLFAEAHTGTPVFGPLIAQRQSKLRRVLRGSLDASSDIRPVADLAQLPLTPGMADDIVAYIIEDPQMRNWPEARREPELSELKNCRAWVGQLEGGDLGYGRSVVAGLRGIIISLLPGGSADRALRATDPIWNVTRGHVYAISRDCASAAAARTLQPS